MLGPTRFIGLVLFTGCITLCGCLMGGHSSVRRDGNYVADTTLGRIEPGKTSQSWVVATLGHPTEKTELAPRHELWKYCYKEVKNSSGYVFLIFGASDRKETSGHVFVELEDGVVTKSWRG